MKGFLKKYGAILIFIVLWEFLSRFEIINSLFIPPFSVVVWKIGRLFSSAHLLRHILLSLGRSLSGILIAAAVSIPLGILLASGSRKLNLALEPVLDIFAQINPFILFHLLLLFLGIGEATKITMIAWLCLWPILFSTLSGVLNADPLVVRAAQGFGLNRFQLTCKVLLPAAAPFIFTGLRLSSGYSLMMLIAAEMMGSSNGLGWMIVTGQEVFDTGKIFAIVTVIALLSILLDTIMKYFEQRASVYESSPLEKTFPG